jgi:hypothetical protein
MDLNSERPVRPALRALARLLLEAAEDNPRLVMRTARGMRNARNRCIASATISTEHRSKPAVAIAIPIKERRDRRRAAITTPPVVEQSDRTEPVVRTDDRHNVLPPSLPWPTTGRSQASRGSRLRHVLSAVMVVAMMLALPANTVRRSGSEATNALPVAGKAAEPVMTASHLPTYEAVPATSPTPNATPPRTDQASAAALASAQVKLADLQAKFAAKARSLAQLSADQHDLQSQVNELSSHAAGAAEQLNELNARIAHAETLAVAQRHRMPATDRADNAAAPARKPAQDVPPAGVGVKPSVPRQLVLARAALINKNQYAARGLMEEAQTLIVFQPATTTARLSTVAASQLTEALVMLGNGNDAGALQCLDQAIAAIRPDVLAVAN